MVRSSDSHHSQIMRGVLDMCVLACVSDEPSYGYGLLQRLKEEGLPAGSEASIYIVLKRLKTKGYVQSELVDSQSGPARKVYEATEEGHEVLSAWIADWCSVRAGVETLVGHCDQFEKTATVGGGSP